MRDHHATAITPAPRDPYLWTLERVRYLLKPLEFGLTELYAPFHLPWRRTLRGWSNGFGCGLNLVYQLDQNDQRLYVSGYQQLVSSARINGHFDHVVNNKLLLPHLLKSVSLDSPRVLGTRRRGRWFLADGSICQDMDTWLRRLLDEHREVVFKPIKGKKGQGLAFLKSGASLTVNGREAGSQVLRELLTGPADAILTSFERQARYSSELYPFTSNSIRVLTLWDYDAGRPFVAAAAQRIGSRRSFPVDNWLAGLGGLSAEVDLETGVLSAGATIEGGRLAWFSTHPETGARIHGIEVSHWEDLKRRICDAAQAFFFAPLLGWDVLVTEGSFTVLEMNGPPGLALHQVHRPLLADPRVRRFYQHHGIIRTDVGQSRGMGGPSSIPPARGTRL